MQTTNLEDENINHFRELFPSSLTARKKKYANWSASERKIMLKN